MSTSGEESKPEAGTDGPATTGETLPVEDVCDETAFSEEHAGPVRVMKESDIEAILREREDMRDQLLRTKADFDNYRKRVLRDAEKNKQFAAETFVRGLLPVVDNLELATQHAEDRSSAIFKGVEMVYKQCQSVLQQFGVAPIEAAGAPFDPNVHEAVMHEESDAYPADTVAIVFQRGYRLGDRVIRPARVAVSKGKRSADEKDPAASAPNGNSAS